MKIVCSKCGFEGNIKDELIPDSGKDVTCPKCKNKFRVDKNIPFTPKPEIVKAPPATRGLTTPKAIPQRNDPKKILIYVFAGILIFGAGYFFGGISNKTEIVTINETPQSDPDSPTERSPESVEKVKPPPKPELPKEEDFVSNEYIEIATIDNHCKELCELTDVKRKLAIKEYSETLVGKTLVGNFTIKNLSELTPSGNSIFGFPNGLYSYYIYAKGKSVGWSNNFIYIGIKSNNDLIYSVNKGMKIYVEGYIQKAHLLSCTLEFNLVNTKIEFLD